MLLPLAPVSVAFSKRAGRRHALQSHHHHCWYLEPSFAHLHRVNWPNGIRQPPPLGHSRPIPHANYLHFLLLAPVVTKAPLSGLGTAANAAGDCRRIACTDGTHSCTCSYREPISRNLFHPLSAMGTGPMPPLCQLRPTTLLLSTRRSASATGVPPPEA